MAQKQRGNGNIRNLFLWKESSMYYDYADCCVQLLLYGVMENEP